MMFMAEEKKDEKKAEEKKARGRKPKKEEKAPKAEEKAAPKEAHAHKETPKEAHAEAQKEAHKPAEAKAEAPKEEARKPAEPPAHKKKRKTAKKAQKVFVARGKRKLSVARATIKAGKGAVRINKLNVSSMPNPYIRSIITEPLRYIGPEANEIDLSVRVNGGGMMGQAQAARTAIAHVLVLYFDQMNLKEKFMSIDRSLLIEDTRRVESKKYRGPKARARFQKSYR